MATMTIRSTYALDVATVEKLERLAKQWGVSKSEALRRSIQAATANHTAAPEPLQAFEALQRSLKLSKAGAKQWVRTVQATRRASSSQRMRRS
jgi:gamma-glutamylcysteine synthetase